MLSMNNKVKDNFNNKSNQKLNIKKNKISK